jgi:hypothetical protein
MSLNFSTTMSHSLLSCGIWWLVRYLTGSLWCRRSQQSFNKSTRSYFPSFSLHVSAPTSHLQVRYTTGCFNGLFLIQRIRCTYSTWCRDVTCCTSVPWLCIPNTCYHMDINIKVVDIDIDIVVHKNVRLSEDIISDILGSDHLTITFT